MIDPVEKYHLLNFARTLNKINRAGFADGGPTNKPPIQLSDYLELGLTIATMSDQERESLQFMLNQLNMDLPKK
tara:strand:+ start:789 stop:1010 length:222 start_codon:yes stop_codon:yes gene_type:complete